jgi:class 3 adenylate cyclase
VNSSDSTVVPTTRYAKSGDFSIAYQVVGAGSNLIVIPGSISHIELGWETPPYSTMWPRMARFARTAIFDKRGTGLSDRGVDLPTLEERMDDVRAVMDAAEFDQAAVLGMSEGGPMALLFAATYPERVTALVLWGSFARMAVAPDYPDGLDPALGEEFCDWIEEHWGNGEVMPEISVHDAPDDDAMRGLLARFERNAATPRMAAAANRFGLGCDVREVLSSISAPTLIVHRADDPVVPAHHGRFLAERIKGARYVERPGAFHFSGAGNDHDLLDEIEEFLTGTREARGVDRVLKTVLFSDIVGSTQRAAALGDHRWRELLDAHDLAVRRELARFQGQEIKTTGDGFFAGFDGPARALHCARAITNSARAIGLDVRVGVHSGECEKRGDDLGGIAVHIGARVLSLAAAGEVLVTNTVRELVTGSGIEFAERGEHELKGVPGAWRVFSVESLPRDH